MLKFNRQKAVGDSIGKFEITNNSFGNPYYYWPENKYLLFAKNHFNIRNLSPNFSIGEGGITQLVNGKHQTIGSWKRHTDKLIVVHITQINENYIIKGDLSKLEDVEIYLSSFSQADNISKEGLVWNWQFIDKNKDFINIILSIHYPFSEIELAYFHDFVLWGSFEMDNPYDQNILFKPGLTFNKNIVWNNPLVNLFESKLSENNWWEWLSDHTDINSSFDSATTLVYDFSKLPLTFKDHLENLSNIFWNKSSFWESEPLSMEEDIERMGKFDSLLANLESCHSVQTFTNFELTTIIENEENAYIFNQSFFDFFWEKLTNDIPEFSLIKFYAKQ